MTEDKSRPKDRKPLGLKINSVPSNPIESSVRQNLSHGRSKTVTVEIKKKRVQTKSSFSSDVSSRLTGQEQSLRLKAVQQAAKERLSMEKSVAPSVQMSVEEAVLSDTNIAPVLIESEEISALAPVKRQEGFQGFRKRESREDKGFEEKEDSKRHSVKTTSSKRRSKNPTLVEDVEEDVFRGPILGLKKLRKHGGHSRGKKVSRSVLLSGDIAIQDLAHQAAEKVGVLIKVLSKLGMTASADQIIDTQTAELVMQELGHSVVHQEKMNLEEMLWNQGNGSSEQARAPIVTVMGHVDHGKTSLLDTLRKSNVAASEAGSITQHIGAYQITTPLSHKITFLDMPGHEAFQQMRGRGALVTDMIVLVVASDDSVNTQTIEAIAHARSAEVPLLVAINKIDKPNARPDTIRQQLLSHEVIVESLGGETLEVEVSATTGKNLDKLEEAIILQADMLSLKASVDSLARGTIIETQMKKGIGVVGTLLVQKGTIRKGDIFVCGCAWGRVRLLTDEHGRSVPNAGPSMPIQVSGFQVAPQPGDRFLSVQTEQEARELVQWKLAQAQRETEFLDLPLMSLEERLKGEKRKDFSAILKADVYGSLEGVYHELSKVQHEEIAVKIIHKEIGSINESDVLLAKASEAVIVGFNVSILPAAKKMAELEGIKILMHKIIYHAVDDLKKEVSLCLEPEIHKEELGSAEVIQIFSSKQGVIAGCSVKKGLLKRGENLQVIRSDKIIFEGVIKSLRHLKDDVKEVKSGHECGIMMDGFDDFQIGDLLRCFHLEKRARVIS